MKAIKPSEYAEQILGGAVTGKTIRNWIKAKKKLPKVDRVEITPTGGYLLFMEQEAQSNVMALVEGMKARAA